MATNNFWTAVPRDEDSESGGNKYLLIGRYSVLNPSSNLSIDASGYFYFNSDASTEFVKLVPRQETLTISDIATVNAENGAYVYDQTVGGKFTHRTLAKQNLITLMAKNEVILVVVDFAGVGRVFGAEDGMKLTTAPCETGSKWDDFKGYTFEFKGRSRKAAAYLTTEELASLLI